MLWEVVRSSTSSLKFNEFVVCRWQTCIRRTCVRQTGIGEFALGERS